MLTSLTRLSSKYGIMLLSNQPQANEMCLHRMDIEFNYQLRKFEFRLVLKVVIVIIYLRFIT